jgi:hypothetical protein
MACRVHLRGVRIRTCTCWRMVGRAARCGPLWRTRAIPATRSSDGWAKHETLLNPDDVSAGHVVRFRRAAPEGIVRSRRQAHPEIVPVGVFTQAQLMRRSRAAGGMRGIGKLDRERTAGKYITC